MNKKLKNSLHAVVLLSCVVFLNACSDPEVKPSTVITDAEGLKIELKWSTGSTEVLAKTESDLDLFIYEGNTTTKVVSSESGSTFETVYLNADNADTDGTYTVKVLSYKVTKNTTYTITVKGEIVSDSYTFNSNFAANDLRVVAALTIKKVGSQYTVTPVN